jgi:hypothetical protein
MADLLQLAKFEHSNNGDEKLGARSHAFRGCTLGHPVISELQQ